VAGGVRALLLRYAGDATALKATAKEIEGAHNQMGANLGQVGTFMQAQLSKLGGAFNVNLGGVKSIVGEGETALKGLAGAGGEAAAGAESAGAGIAGIAGPIGIGIAAAVGLAVGLNQAAGVAASMAGEIRKLQAITGASAEDASRLRAEFVHFGVDVDAGGTALVRFSKNLDEGPPKFRAWFTQAELARLKGQDLTKDLPLLAEKYQSLGTAVERNTFLLDTFGKGGTALRPMLSATADEIVRVGKEADKLGLTFGQQGLAQAKAYTMAQRDMGEAFKGIEVTLGRAAIPAITDFLHWITTGIEDLRSINGWIEKTDHGLGGLGTILGGPIAWGMKAWHLAFGDSTKAVQDSRTALEAENATIQDNAAAMDAAAKKAQAFADSVVKGFNLVGNAADGLGVMATATSAASKADDKAAQDQQKLNELRADGVINLTALASATKGVETAARGEESAQVSLDKATENVAAAQKKELDMLKALQAVMGGPSPADQAKAEEDIGKAKIANTQASLSLGDAISTEQALKASGTATNRQLLDAELATQSARYGSVDAAAAQALAEKALFDLQHEADASSPIRLTAEDNYRVAQEATTDAIRARVDQERALADAQLAQADADKALQVAQAPDEALVKGIADAQRQLATDVSTVGTTSAKVATSFAEFKAQLIQNIADMNSWATNLQFLMDNKVSQAILQPLAQLGPKAGPMLQALRDEVVKHGTGAVNDLGAHLQTATDNMNQTLTDAQAFWTANPLDIQAKLNLTLDSSSLSAISGAIGGAVGAPKIKTFDLGGPVPGPIGLPQWAIVHGGETVFTPGQFSDLLSGVRSMRTAGTANVASSGTFAMMEVHTHLYLDGQEIADNVTTHQLAGARRNVTTSRGLI
jgi:hypothetical protein